MAQLRKLSIIPVSTKSVTDWSVTADEWGNFLISVFNEWLYKDFGKVFIPYFDNFFAVWAGQASSMCTLSEICGKGLAIEPNGDVYSCDHYVYEEFKLGNFQTQSLKKLAFSARQQSFGFAKQKSLLHSAEDVSTSLLVMGSALKIASLRVWMVKRV